MIALVYRPGSTCPESRWWIKEYIVNGQRKYGGQIYVSKGGPFPIPVSSLRWIYRRPMRRVPRKGARQLK